MNERNDKQTNKLARMNYIPRIIATHMATLVILTVEYHIGKPIRYLWPFLVLILAWPHIAYFMVRFNTDKRNPELRNVDIDAFICGLCLPSSCMNPWVAFVSVNLLISNTIRSSHFKRIPLCFLIYMAGVLCGVGIFGFKPVLESGRLTTGLCLLGITGYFTLLSYVSNDMLHRFIRSKRKLKEALLQAESANTAKSDFLANMSHEIRTPMNCIMGVTSLMGDTNLDDEQKEYIENIRSSSEILLAVINDILDLSKMEAGKLDFDEQAFDIRDTVDHVKNLLAFKIKAKGIEFICQVAPEIPMVLMGDSSRLKQVLLNLCSNAEKFTDQGIISLIVLFAGETEDEVELKFEVRDTGIGISKDKMGLLFKNFSQVNTSSTRKYGGTGLGLVISKKLVEIMNGSIGVESREGEGSLFWFTAVFRKHMVITTDMSQEFPGSDSIILSVSEYGDSTNILSDAAKQQVKILIVDDNKVNQMLFQKILNKGGYEGDVVSNGRDAVETVDSDYYDLILMDVQMPDIDGIEVTKIIRAGYAMNPEAVIIGVTAKAMKGDREACVEAGMNDYVTKPVQPQILIEKINRYASIILQEKSLDVQTFAISH